MSTIWTVPITAEILNQRNEGSLAESLGITFTEVGDDFLTARMTITPRFHQPFGIMHGGVSCLLAETVGSVGGSYCIKPEQYCVGIDINTNHISAVRSGELIAIGKPYHLGRLTQVWSIEIRSATKLISISRLTLSNLLK